MPDLLLELRSEEIPARMQRKAAGDLKKMVTDALVEGGLTYEAAREYWTPRRLALDIRGVDARSKPVREERKGPRTDAPEQAIAGFLKAAGLKSVAEATVQSDPKKGDFYIAITEKPGRAAEEIIADALPAIIRDFPWPKSMRWGKASVKPGSLRWVRPLQSIVCTFGPETEEPVVVDFEVDGIRAGNVTYGHRFHAPDAITVRRFEDYVAKLDKARVILDAERRKEIILADAKNLAFANGLELVEDAGLLEEVAGLVEWPVVLMGEFEAEYLSIPAEVIRLTIRANQKCFVTRPPSSPRLRGEGAERSEAGEGQSRGAGPSSGPSDHLLPASGEKTGALAPRFILVSNIEATDGGKEIAYGNGKVVRARLSDALYFWKTDQANLPDLETLKPSADRLGLDLAKPLDQRMARLDKLGVTFHAKLGTQGERVERIAKLAEELAGVISPLVGEMSAQPTEGGGASGTTAPRSVPPPPNPPRKGEGFDLAALARRAALLCKADLTTEIVGEFPELQGAMGRKYAELQGEHPSVCAAIEDHYKPLGPSDRAPTDPVAIAVALADKLDTLVGFWAIDEKPTGSKDPYALRRAALGVIRIVLENGVRLRLTQILFNTAYRLFDMHAAGNYAYLVEKNKYGGISLLPRSVDSTFSSSIDAPKFERSELLAGRFTFRNPDEISVITPILLDQDFGEYGDLEILPILKWSPDLLAFFHDRLKVYLRDTGARHDLIDAVLAEQTPSSGQPVSPSAQSAGHLLPQGEKGGAGAASALPGETGAGNADLPSPLVGEGGARSAPGEGGSWNDDLLTVVRRVEALGSFLSTDAGVNLLAGYKRAANILAAEEKKGTVAGHVIDATILKEKEEIALFEALNQASNAAGQALEKEDFSAAMSALSALREPVDSFFEKVLVNDEDKAIRANRLALLNEIRRSVNRVADFSKIAG